MARDCVNAESCPKAVLACREIVINPAQRLQLLWVMGVTLVWGFAELGCLNRCVKGAAVLSENPM